LASDESTNMSSLSLLLAATLVVSVLSQQTINSKNCRKQFDGDSLYVSLYVPISGCVKASDGNPYTPRCADGWLRDKEGANNQCYRLSGIKTRVKYA